jgi:hypothetical protein
MVKRVMLPENALACPLPRLCYMLSLDQLPNPLWNSLYATAHAFQPDL